jgi:hypothetical protein
MNQLADAGGRGFAASLIAKTLGSNSGSVKEKTA